MAALTIVTGGALALTSSALAQRTGLFAEVEVKASNGYQAFIAANHWKHPRHHPRLWVTVASNRLSSWSTYRARARLTRHHLEADLGEFGTVNLRFRRNSPRHSPMSEARKAPRPGALVDRLRQQALGCTVSVDARAYGKFKGRIRFHGEDGYTRIRARKADGFISPSETECSKVPRDHGVALDAGSGHVRFEADQFRRSSNEALFIAKEKERVGRVTINRTAIGGGHRASFSFGFDPKRAHVAPQRGRAIAGSADLTPSRAWTGSLSASFPGAPDVPLAGPEFSARLGRF